MNTWEETITRPLHAMHIGSIRNQILVFAVLATLIPALATTCVSYTQSRRLLNDKVTQDLRAASSEAARGVALLVTEWRDELRAAASSYVVSENLAKLQGKGAAQALGRLRDHLNSVRERFPDQEALAILDDHGRIVTSSGRAGNVRLSAEGLSALRSDDLLVGDAFWDVGSARAVIVVAVPIRQPDGRFVAAFAAKINLRAVTDLLQRLAPGGPLDTYLITDQGKLVVRSQVSSADLMRTKMPEPAMTSLLQGEGQAVTYTPADGRAAIGTLRRAPEVRWAAVAEMPHALAVRPVKQLWNVAALTIALLCAGVGLLVYVLGLLIVRPLGRLTAAATHVAAGDLTIDLPVGGGGEVGYLTQVFNTLVTRLRERESQADLERLSVTDALTGLYNRRHLMGTLASEVQRTRRLRRPFSVLLADVDHFKSYNDTHGHPAGDVALVKIADLLRQSTRGVDCVARYGGEEFLVMLLETTVATAVIVAERIRARIAAEQFTGGRMTISIGVAECPGNGDTPEALIASADAALYRAKGEGRDRVVTAGGPERDRIPEREKEKGRRKGER